MRELNNSPQLMRDLRTIRRVRAPNFAAHQLIRVSRRYLHIPIYFFKAKQSSVDFGDAPTDTFYSQGALYAGPFSQRTTEKNSIWHDLCHAMVAEQEGKLGLDNFDSTINDEDRACRIEFWLGFVTGYYSLAYLIKLIFDYNYNGALRMTHVAYRNRIPKTRWVIAGSLLEFLKNSRMLSIQNPCACRISKSLGVYSIKQLKQEFRTRCLHEGML